MARKARLAYTFKFVSGSTERFLVENSAVTKEQAIAGLASLMRCRLDNAPVFEINGVLVNLDNVETVQIDHSPAYNIQITPGAIRRG